MIDSCKIYHFDDYQICFLKSYLSRIDLDFQKYNIKEISANEKRKKQYFLGRIALQKLFENQKITWFNISNKKDGGLSLPSNISASISHFEHLDYLFSTAILSLNPKIIGIDFTSFISKERSLKLSNKILTNYEKAFFKQSYLNFSLVFSVKESIFKAFNFLYQKFFWQDIEIKEISNDFCLAKLFNHLIKIKFMFIENGILTWICVNSLNK